MTQIERNEFKKAYVELYEIIKVLPREDQEKIPDTFLKNLKDNMDKEYKFTIDKEKDILNQNYMIETKALFVELYERYLAPEEEKDFWLRYDKICSNMIEDEKRKKYDTENIFKDKKHAEYDTIQKENETILPAEIKKENIVTKFLKFMKKIFHL